MEFPKIPPKASGGEENNPIGDSSGIPEVSIQEESILHVSQSILQGDISKTAASVHLKAVSDSSSSDMQKLSVAIEGSIDIEEQSDDFDISDILDAIESDFNTEIQMSELAQDQASIAKDKEKIEKSQSQAEKQFAQIEQAQAKIEQIKINLKFTLNVSRNQDLAAEVEAIESSMEKTLKLAARDVLFLIEGQLKPATAATHKQLYECHLKNHFVTADYAHKQLRATPEMQLEFKKNPELLPKEFEKFKIVDMSPEELKSIKADILDIIIQFKKEQLEKKIEEEKKDTHEFPDKASSKDELKRDIKREEEKEYEKLDFQNKRALLEAFMKDKLGQQDYKRQIKEKERRERNQRIDSETLKKEILGEEIKVFELSQVQLKNEKIKSVEALFNKNHPLPPTKPDSTRTG